MRHKSKVRATAWDQLKFGLLIALIGSIIFALASCSTDHDDPKPDYTGEYLILGAGSYVGLTMNADGQISSVKSIQFTNVHLAPSTANTSIQGMLMLDGRPSILNIIYKDVNTEKYRMVVYGLKINGEKELSADSVSVFWERQLYLTGEPHISKTK
jgi:hypothetical protein